jgi:serine/threonine-protein kinase
MFSDGNSIFYRASDIQLERPVILRTSPLPHNPDEAAAFLRLVRAIGRLSHPNIATIYDTGAANDLAFIASEIPEGQSSFQQIRTRGPLNVSELKSTMRKVLTGLDYAHSQEIIHGNLKPANINVNSALNAKLTNFSFPTMARPGQEAWSTNSTISAMDPQFLAPEQIMGNPSDARADIYAVGLLIFYFLTGRTPFEVRRVSDIQEIARIQIQSALPRPSTVRATVPNRIDEIFMKCTHKSPAARFQSVNEVLDQLEGSESNFTG